MRFVLRDVECIGHCVDKLFTGFIEQIINSSHICIWKLDRYLLTPGASDGLASIVVFDELPGASYCYLIHEVKKMRRCECLRVQFLGTADVLAYRWDSERRESRVISLTST